jgi:hypothetical protein
MKKLLLNLLLTVCITQIANSQQSVNSKYYDINEKIILVNNFNIFSPYNISDINTKIGIPNKIEDGGPDVINEFGYNTYNLKYGISSILFSDNLISFMDIRDNNLCINKIKIGDTINMVKNEFLKYNQDLTRIYIVIGDNVLSFYFNSLNNITRITYFTPI